MKRSGKRCVLYPRVSTEMQVDGFSDMNTTEHVSNVPDKEWSEGPIF